jgi:two-component system nitrogen regulation sensor histidine kinase NtrY
MLALLGGLPAVLLSVFLLRRADDLHPLLKTWLGVFVVVTWLAVLAYVTARWRYHLRTVSNLLSALREGDYSFRVRPARRTDPLGEVIAELNALSETLRRQRVEDLEATALVRKVMGEIDVAVFAFDSSHRLRQVNDSGARLVGGGDELLGRGAEELGLASCLTGTSARTVQLELGRGDGRWEMRRGAFRQHGRPHHLVLLSDVSRALRAEELGAWKRLIRVIGHELNNSLAPIKSLAGSMDRLLNQDPLPEDWRGDVSRGLDVISSRAEALARFMSDCSRLAKMPEPTPAPMDIGRCVRRVAELETRLAVRVEDGPEVITSADQDQIEQVLINLVRNAVEACLETGGSVEMGWRIVTGSVIVSVRDEGPGLPASANLFVPFFTTKSEGSGIGLFLCRQIAEAHGGTVKVRDRDDRLGCEARLKLPLKVEG